MNRRPLPSAVRNLRPTRTARFELMPGVVLYDHEADPDDVPVLPDLVALALSVLLRSVDVPGSVSRPGDSGRSLGPGCTPGPGRGPRAGSDRRMI